MSEQIPVLQDRTQSRYIYTVSADKTTFISHDKSDFNKGETVLRGFCDTINDKLYALFRDRKNALWLLGKGINPLMITSAVTAEIEGTEDDEKERKFTVRVDGDIYLQLLYHRNLQKIGSLWDFPEDGDFGFLIWEILSSPEKREYIWTDKWYDNAHISGDAL